MNEIMNVLANWTNLSIVGGSLIVGYVLNNYVSMNNKHIPLIMAFLGVALSLALGGYVSFEVTVLGGALSGLASTGMHQVLHQYIKGNEKIEPYYNAYKQKEDK